MIVDFAVGITGASSTIGPIIPPSLPMVIYGVMANTSVGKLFAAGFIPGLVMAGTMMIMVAWYAHARGFHRDARFSLRVSLGHSQESVPAPDDPGSPDRRDDDRRLHPHRGRDRGHVLRHDPGHVCVPDPFPADFHQG